MTGLGQTSIPAQTSLYLGLSDFGVRISFFRHELDSYDNARKHSKSKKHIVCNTDIETIKKKYTHVMKCNGDFRPGLRSFAGRETFSRHRDVSHNPY